MSSGNHRAGRAVLRGGCIALILAALSYSAVTAPALSDSPDGVRIEIENFTFRPGSMTVKAGSSVTWVNNDDEAHTVVSDSGLFRSSAFDTGESFTFRFDRPGTYRVTCSLHPRMLGTIAVE